MNQYVYNNTKIKKNQTHLIEIRKKITEAQSQDCSMDGQELTNIESKIDNEKSDDIQINQVVESVGTENSLDAVLQEQHLQTIEVKQVENITQSAQQQGSDPA
jgi:hypothetical protein